MAIGLAIGLVELVGAFRRLSECDSHRAARSLCSLFPSDGIQTNRTLPPFGSDRSHHPPLTTGSHFYAAFPDTSENIHEINLRRGYGAEVQANQKSGDTSSLRLLQSPFYARQRCGVERSKIASRIYDGSPIRRTRSLKRGAERNGSKQGRSRTPGLNRSS